MYKLAVLLTCFNRKNKTISCLDSLYRAFKYFNLSSDKECFMKIFLTDDNSSDGTSDAILNKFTDNIVILKGNGNLFWAGGMRNSWNAAIADEISWDYYLLLNDDVDVYENLFFELFQVDEFSKKTYNSQGLYSGITCSKEDESKLTYGGSKWKNRFFATSVMLPPTGHPQECDMTNANILMVPKLLVEKNGIFWDGYTHGKADYDYSIQVKKKGFPVLLTSNYCGKCDNDHIDGKEVAKKIIGMNLSERKKYFNNPLISNGDYIRFVKRNARLRLPFVALGRFLNVYFPKIYYKMNNLR